MVNVYVPAGHLEPTVGRLLDRIGKCGGGSITKPGDPFPGGDICKNCPLIIFKKGDSGEQDCAACGKS